MPDADPHVVSGPSPGPHGPHAPRHARHAEPGHARRRQLHVHRVHQLLLLLVMVGRGAPGRGRGLLGRRARGGVLGVLVPAPGPALARHLGAGGHVGGPVGLLAGVVAVGGVPAAIEDGLLTAVGTPAITEVPVFTYMTPLENKDSTEIYRKSVEKMEREERIVKMFTDIKKLEIPTQRKFLSTTFHRMWFTARNKTSALCQAGSRLE